MIGLLTRAFSADVNVIIEPELTEDDGDDDDHISCMCSADYTFCGMYRPGEPVQGWIDDAPSPCADCLEVADSLGCQRCGVCFSYDPCALCEATP